MPEQAAPDPGFWDGRSVLVTGAGGLLGSWLARTLASRGARVAGLDIEPSRWGVLEAADGVARVEGDVRDGAAVAALLAGHEPSVVVHLAAQALVGDAQADPVSTFEHNVLGTWQLLDAVRRGPPVEAVVVASSDKAYGDAGGVAYTEDMPLRGRNPYDASKVCTDVLSQSYAHAYGLPVVITRCGNLYGGGDLHWSRIVPDTLRALLSGRRPVIRSDGTAVRDYLYVEDAVAGVMLAAEWVAGGGTPGEAFNLAGENRLAVLELVDRLRAMLGSDLEPVVRAEAAGEIPHQRVSSAKAATVLGWHPAHDLDDGLARTVAWYRDHLTAAPASPGG